MVTLQTLFANSSAPPTQETADTSSCDEGQEEKKGPLVVIPNVAGMMSVACLQEVFTSGWTLNVDQGQGYITFW